MNKFFKLLLLIAVIALATAPVLLAQQAPGGTSGSIGSKDNQILNYEPSTGALSIQRGNSVTITSTASNAWGYDGNAVAFGKFIGTTNSAPLIFRQNNLECARFTSTIATLSTTTPSWLKLPDGRFGKMITWGLDNGSWSGIGYETNTRLAPSIHVQTNQTLFNVQSDYVINISGGSELFRFTGSGNFGIGVLNPTSRLTNSGSEAKQYVKINSATTLGEDCLIWADGATSYLVTLPSPGSCPKRVYYFRCTGVNKTISNYSDFTNATSNVLKAGQATALVSDGSSWLQFQ